MVTLRTRRHVRHLILPHSAFSICCMLLSFFCLPDQVRTQDVRTANITCTLVWKNFQVWFLRCHWDPNSCFIPLPVHWWRIIHPRLTSSSDLSAPSVQTAIYRSVRIYAAEERRRRDMGRGEISFVPLHRLDFQFNSPTKFPICNNWISIRVLKTGIILLYGSKGPCYCIVTGVPTHR